MATHTRTKLPNHLTFKIEPKRLLIMLALVLILYVVIPQLGEVQQGMSRLEHAHPGWVIAAGLSYLTSSLFSVGVYRLITPRRLPLVRTAIVQYAGSFANRLLPAGIGALGVDYMYLRKQKCTQPATLAALLLNNVLGTVGHVMLLVGIVLAAPSTFSALDIDFKLRSMTGLMVLLGAATVVGALFIMRRIRTKLVGAVRETWQQLRNYRRKPGRVTTALLFSFGITMAHSMSLWASAQALDLGITISAAIVVLAVGVLLGAVIPSPGGLGGAEAGLVAGLVAFGMPAASAVAVAILYRLASYWLGFAVGAVAFFAITKRNYV
jgi:undecaprenyl-diphosphatase